MNSTIVKIEKSGNRFNAWDQNGVKRTSEILTSTRKSAYNAGMALEQRSGKGGRHYTGIRANRQWQDNDALFYLK